MATLTAPGVYVQEIPSGSRPIPLAGTSTAAFFGEAERGPLDRVEKVFNFSQFEERFGGFLTGGRFLAHSVYQFFRNGGGACYVGRVAREGAAAAASVTVLDRGGAQAQPTLTFRASSPGAWGNELRVVVSSAASTDPANQFNVALYRDAEGGGAPDLLATYTDLSMDPDDPRYVVDYVAANSTLLEVVDEGSTNVINGYSESGLVAVEGSDLLGAAHRQFQIDVNDDGVQTVDLTDDIVAETPNLADPAAVAASIQRVVRTLVPLRGSTDPNSYAEATVTFAPEGAGPNGVFRITAGGAASAASRVVVTNGVDPATNAAGLLSLGAQNGGAEVHGSANQRPQVTPGGDFYLLGDDTVAGAVSAVTPGADTPTPQSQDYVNALSRLDTVRDVSLIAVPGIGNGAVVDAGMAYCASRPLSDCFFIGDMDAADDTYAEAIAFRDALNTPNSYGAVYFPWILALDPSGVSEEPIALPPSGFIAGLYGRIDGRRGVWKAPAGTEALLNGARGLTATLTDGEHGDLNNNPASVCVIRRVPGTGIVTWGARTVSSDPEYTYIPVRRTAIFLRVSIYNGIQWAVFEPNDEPLWASLRLNIGSFMNLLFRRGAFQGSKPSDAYFVKCDAETTTQADIDLGIVNVLVGFAPLKPAEFVVVKIRQIAGQSS